ncbi:hypothetical protein ISCGN_031620 [Ixodes scapularis]
MPRLVDRTNIVSIRRSAQAPRGDRQQVTITSKVPDHSDDMKLGTQASRDPTRHPLSSSYRGAGLYEADSTARSDKKKIRQIILLSIASSDGAHMLDELQDATKLIVLEPTTGKQWFLGPILVDFKLGALGACQHWSSATMPLQKPLSNASRSRHATTAMKERSDIFLLQIILLSIASSDGAHMLDEPQDATKLIVLEPTTGKQWFLGPILVYFKLGALGACQHWSSATMPLQKPLSHASHSRHATTAMKERSDIFLLQVL